MSKLTSAETCAAVVATYATGVSVEAAAHMHGVSADTASRAINAIGAMRINNNGWPVEHDAILRRMAAEGHSGAVIGQVLGKSRNAILGRAWRMGVKLAGSPPPRVSRPRFPPKPKPARIAKLAKPKGRMDISIKGAVKFSAPPTPVPIETPGENAKPLLDLTFGDCRWPVNDGEDSTHGFLFCADPKTLESPYCACHAARSKGDHYGPLKIDKRWLLQERAA